MSVTLPGLGVATPLPELLDNYLTLCRNLPAVIDLHPNARVIRPWNRIGNLSIVVERDGRVYCIGHIDVRTGEIELWDEPWPMRAEEDR